MVKESVLQSNQWPARFWLPCLVLVLMMLILLAGCRMEAMEDTAPETAVRYSPTPLLLREPSPFVITDHSPVQFATGQALNREVMISFDTPLLAATVSENTVRLWLDEQPVAANLVYVNDTRTVRLVPRQPLQPNQHYRVEVNSRLLAETGAPFAGVEWWFKTAGFIGATSQSTLDACGTEEALAMLDAINQVRLNGRQCGAQAMPAVAPLAYQCQLAEVAESHANDMARYQVLSHLSSDGMDLASRYQTFGVQWQRLAENVAATSTDSVSSVLSNWFDRESHCRTLLDPDVTHFGMGRSQAGSFHFWVQNFASGLQGAD